MAEISHFDPAMLVWAGNLDSTTKMYISYPRERGPTTECRPIPPPPLRAQFPAKVKCLLEYAPMCSCLEKRSSNG
jgi:hypothetical protein